MINDCFTTPAPGLIEALEQSFRVKKEFLKSAEETLSKIVTKHLEKQKEEKSKKKKKKSKKSKNLTFIGIHSRRTDHLAFEKVKGNNPLKVSYYLEAMGMYRSVLPAFLFFFKLEQTVVAFI